MRVFIVVRNGIKMAVFILPAVRDTLKYHTRWNEKSTRPYIEELMDLWAENNVEGVLDVCVQGPMMTRFGIVPDDMKSAGRIIKLESTYKVLFHQRDLRVYRRDGRIYIDVPWQRDSVYLGDLLTCREYEQSEGLPVAIGMNLYRDCILDDMTDIPHLLVSGGTGSGISDFLQGILLSVLLSCTPNDIDLYLCSSRILNFEEYRALPYCHIVSTTRKTISLLAELSEEVDRRYAQFYRSGCHSIYQFNEKGGVMRHRFVMITDYSLLASLNRQTAMGYLLRLAELAGPCGIHLVVATASPSSLRGLRESFPARVCMKVNSAADSYTVLEQRGAEKLKHKGALLYLDGHDPDPMLLQSGSVTSREINLVLNGLLVNYVGGRKQSIFAEIDEGTEHGTKSAPPKEEKEKSQSGRENFWSRLFR